MESMLSLSCSFQQDSLELIGNDSFNQKILSNTNASQWSSLKTNHTIQSKTDMLEDNSDIFVDVFDTGCPSTETQQIGYNHQSVSTVQGIDCFDVNLNTSFSNSSEYEGNEKYLFSEDEESGFSFPCANDEINLSPVDISSLFALENEALLNLDRTQSPETDVAIFSSFTEPQLATEEKILFNRQSLNILDELNLSDDSIKEENCKQTFLFTDIQPVDSTPFDITNNNFMIRNMSCGPEGIMTNTQSVFVDKRMIGKSREKYRTGGIYVDGRIVYIEARKKGQSIKCGLPQPSRFCHICLRRAEKVTMTACARLNSGGCRKVVCKKCFEEYGWNWEMAIRSDTHWECTHCQQSCPERAQCFIYKRTNHRRHEALMRRKAIENLKGSDDEDVDGKPTWLVDSSVGMAGVDTSSMYKNR